MTGPNLTIVDWLVGPHVDGVRASAKPPKATPNIGYPKLIMVGQASAAKPWPQPIVSNFVAARGEPIRMATGVPVPYRFIGFPTPAGHALTLALARPRLADMAVRAVWCLGHEVHGQ